MNEPERMVAPERATADTAEAGTRPALLDDFVGQSQTCANLRVFIQAARERSEALDHVLFYGPPGLGKTTLAQIVARELGVGFRATSGPVIVKAGDLAAILTNLQPRDVLFIDGPPNTTGLLARYPALPMLMDRLSPGAVIVLDDAARMMEQAAIRRWRRDFPGLSVHRTDTKGGGAVMRISDNSI